MWNDLPKKERDNYKYRILGWAALTPLFTQKAGDDKQVPTPYVNSKYQEKAFVLSFSGSTEEDIGNSSFDISLKKPEKRYLVGIKTFGYSSSDQKVAQFKKMQGQMSEIQAKIVKNSSRFKTVDQINWANRNEYLELASMLSKWRNLRIKSSIENLRGFQVDAPQNVESVYHVLMCSSDGKQAKIYVGEIDYSMIDINHLKILGCTTVQNPLNFRFTDGHHIYKFTSADDQMYMDFRNEQIRIEEWPVTYDGDPTAVINNIVSHLYGVNISELPKQEFPPIINNRLMSVSWKLNVEPYSGFNSFYGVGSKCGKEQRIAKINSLNRFTNVDGVRLLKVKSMIAQYLAVGGREKLDRDELVKLRNRIVDEAKMTRNNTFVEAVEKIVFRPMTETYIPIPRSKQFHTKYPDFFVPDGGKMKEDGKKLALPEEHRRFNLVFEPSGNTIECHITQDTGKAIESVQKQTILGEWLLTKVFQLGKREPLTQAQLDMLDINGLRLYKEPGSDDIHAEFIWIDDDNLPADYIDRILEA